MIAWPVAERARRRSSTPRSAARGSSFSMPTHTTWSGGSAIPRSALPSFVQITTPPVSARAKFAPVMPACAARNAARRCRRATSARAAGSASPGSLPRRAANSSPISSFRRWMAGSTMWLGASRRSCTMRSPRSVSVTSIPWLSRCALRPHSSVSIDLLFTTRSAPRSRRIPSTMALCSAASAAQWTRAPRRVALRSNCSRYSSSRARVWRRMAAARSRSRSHSGSAAAAASRRARTCQSAASCQAARSASRRKRAAAAGWPSAPGSLTGAAPGRPGSRPRASPGAGPRGARRGRAGGAGSSRRRR